MSRRRPAGTIGSVSNERRIILAIGALLALLAVAESTARIVTTPPGVGNPNRATFLMVFALLALATTAPVALPNPQQAVLVCTAATLVSLAGFHTITVAGVVAQLVVAYRLGRRGPPILVVLLLAVVYPVLAMASGSDGNRIAITVLAVTVPVAELAGLSRRAEVEARNSGAAEQVIADSQLEHIARGERARIARELHDVVAHHISMVAVQAETARLTIPGLPESGARRLLTIGDTARAALTEMRRLLGVLREDAEEPERAPQPGLGDLPRLLDEARDACGSGLRLILRGPPTGLDPGVELAAYRIVQEALTNARRHAPGAAVDVELEYGEDVLRVCIRDNGPGPPTGGGGGHGLAGMRERAAAVGGELRYGTTPGGGFVVEATLPGATG